MSGVDSVIEGPKKLHDLSQKLAGGQYVALFLWLGGVVLLHGGLKESVELIFPVITITTVLYRLGGSLDDLVFDPLFQPETDTNPLLRWFGRGMRQARRNAAHFMLTGERQYAPPDGEEQNEEPRTEGIYSRSEMLYRGTSVWNKRVEPNLRLSKAVRCLVIPSSLVFIYDFWPSFLPRLVPTGELFKPFGFLGTTVAQWVCLSLCLIFVSLYLALRLRHMRTPLQSCHGDGRLQEQCCEPGEYPSPSGTTLVKGLHILHRRTSDQANTPKRGSC